MMIMVESVMKLTFIARGNQIDEITLGSSPGFSDKAGIEQNVGCAFAGSKPEPAELFGGYSGKHLSEWQS